MPSTKSSADSIEFFGSESELSYKDFAKAYREKLNHEDPEMKGKQKSKLLSRAWKHSPQNPNRTIGDAPASKKKTKKGPAAKKSKGSDDEEADVQANADADAEVQADDEE